MVCRHFAFYIRAMTKQRKAASKKKRAPRRKPATIPDAVAAGDVSVDAVAAIMQADADNSLLPEFKEAQRDKHPGGRPTLYKPEYAHIAAFMCRNREATDEELAECFDVAVSTIYLWKRVNPEFSEAIKPAKASVDDRVEEALAARALGYSHPDSHVSVIDKGVVITPLIKHYPPDTAAAFIWLKNRRPEKWRDKSEVNVTGLTLEQMVAAARKPAESTTPVATPVTPAPATNG